MLGQNKRCYSTGGDMKFRHSACALLICGLLFSYGSAHAATLDFTQINSDVSNASSISLSNATINHFDANGGFLHLPDFGDTTDSSNGKGSICALSNSSCFGSMTITFTQDIQNLKIGFKGADDGDEVFVSGWKDNSLTNFTNITADGIFDFSFLGVIDHLILFNDSTDSGLLYQDFSFDYAEGTDVISTPLPAALPMFAAALGIIGFIRLRRK